jgi:hypothetical protein
VAELVAKDHSLEVWTAYFDAIKAGHAASHLGSPGSTDGLSSPWEEVTSLDSLRKASDTFRTPKRLKLGSILSPENVPVLSIARGSPLANVFPLMPDKTAENQSMKVEQALRKIFGVRNKIETNFQTVHLELDSTARSETKYRNTVNSVIGDIQEAIQQTDNHVQILQASLGKQVDDPESRPMLIWEAIARLRADAARAGAISEGSYLYLDKLRKKIPNWGTTLENLTAGYIDTIPKINRNLMTMRAKIATLEGSTLSGAVNPFSGIGIGVPASTFASAVGPTSGASYVLKGDYENSKKEIEDAFLTMKASIQSSGGGGTGALNVKVDKAIQ